MNKEMDKILGCVCAEYGVRETDVKGRSRERDIAEARMIAVYMAYRIGGVSKMRIAEYFGRKYSTVFYSVSQVEDWLRFDRIVRAHYERIKARLEE